MDLDKDKESNDKQVNKVPYNPPKFIQYGSINELTTGAGSKGNDFGVGMMNSTGK